MATRPSLLVLAAGMGSRYGGLKQIDPVGPADETIIEYSIYDALRAGFGKIVFVIRHDIEKAFRETIGSKFEKKAPVEYVFQELDKVPPGFTVPPTRKKPWGTGHAILMGADAIGEPFAVINADDFYGAASHRLLHDHLTANTSDYLMVGFALRNTLSEHGTVSRGVCACDSDGYLKSIAELTKVERDHTGGAKGVDESGVVCKLTGDEMVSMNLWGFRPTLFDHLREMFADFLKKRGSDDKAEFYIPSAINSLVNSGNVRLKVLRTPDSWFGITFRQDQPHVAASIRALVKRGDYPSPLWK
jgi:UTP-glucose-1-phosphate uridylyltransferase